MPMRELDSRRPAPLWILALITLGGTLAMHIFVPALPFAGADLGASGSAMQLTLSAYIAGLALGQLTYGPLSDYLGRRAVLLAGMAIYALASVAAVFVPDVGSLIAVRFVQALGGCSGLVLGRAIVRDQTAGDEAARKLALMNLMTMAGPGISPLIGSLIAALAGWRSIFLALALLGAVNFALIWWAIPRQGGGGRQGHHGILKSYGSLVRSRRFVCYAVGGSCATASIYAYIAAAPFIFVEQLHRPAHEVGLYLAVNILGAWLGSLTASRLIGSFSASGLMVAGNVLSCAGAAAFLLFVLLGALSLPAIILPMLVLTYGAGVASPTALAKALGVNPAISGSASGLYGALQMAIGGACAALSGIGKDAALAAGLVLLAAGLVAQVSFWAAREERAV